MVNYLQVENLSKSFGDLRLFDNLSLSINEGERVGLIARNGYGKSTLLSIIAGGESADSGDVTFRRDLRVAYLVQEPHFPKGITTLEGCFLGDSEQLRAIKEYNKAMDGGSEQELHHAIEMMDHAAAWDYEAKAKQILSRLKITDFSKPIDQLSGGQLKRVALANALLIEPQLLILDEPTNHLDLEATTWLEEYLSQSRLTLLMVTHDRYYLDRVCNKIIEIEDRQTYSYNGNFNYYLTKRSERLDAMAAQAESDRNLYRKELDWMRRQPQARATKAKSRIESFYELEDRLRRERDDQKVELASANTYIGKKIFEVRGLSKSYGKQVILKDFDYTFNRYEKMGIVGGNGVGKSTFIKMLLGEVAPDSGVIDIGQTVRFGYYSQTGGIKFDSQTKVIDVVSDIAQSIEMGNGVTITASQLLQRFLFSPTTQHNYVQRLSGGERRRLYLCTVLMRNPNFLVLDEPTNDLDIMTLQVLEEYLTAFSGCVIVVSHDRYFMDKVADHLMVFEGEGKLRDFPSSYSDYIVWQKLRDQQQSAETQPKAAPKEDPQRNAQRANSTKLSYKERREMEQCEGEIEKLESLKLALEAELGSGTLSIEELSAKSSELGAILVELDEKTMRWLELSERDS